MSVQGVFDTAHMCFTMSVIEIREGLAHHLLFTREHQQTLKLTTESVGHKSDAIASTKRTTASYT
jgi:hypothetical protein